MGTVRCRRLMVLVLLSLLCFLRAYTGSGVDDTIGIKVVTFCGEYLTTNTSETLTCSGHCVEAGVALTASSPTVLTSHSLLLTTTSRRTRRTQQPKTLITGFIEFQPNLTDDGWSGYGTMDEFSMLFVAVAPEMYTEAANISTAIDRLRVQFAITWCIPSGANYPRPIVVRMVRTTPRCPWPEW